MDFKTTVVLLLLVAIIGGAVSLLVWRDRIRPADDAALVEELDRRTPDQEQAIFDPQPAVDDVVRVTLQRAGEAELAFERVITGDAPSPADEWAILEPIEVPAERAKVLGLVRTFTGLRSRKQIEPGGKRAISAADAGLEPPRATVTCETRDGGKYVVEVGSKVVMSTDTHVRVAGKQTIHVVSQDLQSQLKSPLSEYRTKSLAKLNLGEIRRVQVDHDGRRYVLARGTADEWVIESPVRAFADAAKVRNQLLMPLTRLRVEEFVDDGPEDLARYGLDAPFMTVTVTTAVERAVRPPEGEDGAEAQPPETQTTTSTHVFRFGAFADLKSEYRFVQTDAGPWVATVVHRDIENIVPKLKQLRDPKIARVKAEEITAIGLSVGGMSASLVREDGQWRSDGVLEQLDLDAVAELVQSIADLSCDDYVDAPESPAAYGLDAPRATLTVTAEGRPQPLTILVGNPTSSGHSVYLQIAGDDTVFVTSEQQARRLACSPLELRSREIFTFSPEALQRVTLQHPSTRYVIERKGSAWTLVEPSDAPIHAAAARTLAADLSRLRAARVIAQDAFAAYGLDRPVLTVAFELGEAPPLPTTEAEPEAAQPQDRTAHTLRVGWVDEKAYARRDDDPFVFELDTSVYQVLGAELIDPRLFDFKGDDIVAVRIVATGGTLEFARDGQTWRYAPDPYVKLAQNTMKDFMRDLADLRAERYLAYREGDLESAGLVEPPASVTIRLSDGREFIVHMTQERPGELPRRAALVAPRRIFLLRQSDCQKLMRGLDDYIMAGTPAAQPSPG